MIKKVEQISFAESATRLPRKLKICLAVLLDIFLCAFGTWTAFSLRFWELVQFNWELAIASLISMSIAISLFFSWGFYKLIFRYVNTHTLHVLTKAIVFYTIIYGTMLSLIGFKDIPRSIGLMQPMILFLLIIISRWLVTIWLNQNFEINKINYKKKEIVIYGAGSSGRQLAANLIHSNEFKLVFFIDDNKSFWGGTIDGYPVKSPSSLELTSELQKPKELWLAMAKLSPLQRGRLIYPLRKLGLHVRTIPSFSDLTNGQVNLSDIRELDINELLGRAPVMPDKELLQQCIFEKTVLVTGAGGSIGSEICRQAIINNPKYVILVENSEIALYNIHSELKSLIEGAKGKYNKTTLIPLLVNIQDSKSLEHIFKNWKPYTVYHAAAYKHVPIVEHNVVAGIKNNVIGTLKCASLAMKYKVKHFVLISTDKAVRPTNIMGASKRLSEMVLQLLNNDKNNKNTLFCMVRFGNVLGSSGSVTLLFRKQIENGGPVTLTDENVTRYFMTVTEAAQLVIQAGSMSKGGEVFLLDMGKPVRIIDLARNMIETAGFQVKDDKTPWGEIEIKISGLRPGEKLYEELLIGKNPRKTRHSRILQANELFVLKEDFNKFIQRFIKFLDQNNIEEIRNLLKDTVSGYMPSENVDWIEMSKQYNQKKFK